MTYEEARAYLKEVEQYGSELGLELILELLNRLDNPQQHLKFIHIAGTNGKGSVLAFVSTILKCADYKVGRYVSPTLFSYRERIQINEGCIKKERLAQLVTKVKVVLDQMVRDGFAHPTIFEVETVLAFLYFQEENCDLVVLETGLGGRLDATNVIATTLLEIMTPISLDHQGFLGHTLEEIGREKAGIIKPHTKVISAEQEGVVWNVLEQVCKEMSCELKPVCVKDVQVKEESLQQQKFRYKGYDNLIIHLLGRHQRENAILAMEAIFSLIELGYTITEAQLRKGLFETSWEGRLTVLGKEPLILMDGAHNEGAALVLREMIETQLSERNIHMIMGVFKDKEYEKIVEIMAPFCESIIAVDLPDAERTLDAKVLAAVWQRYTKNVAFSRDLEEGIKRGVDQAGKEDVVLIFGSLSFLCEAKRVVDKLTDNLKIKR